MTRGNKPSKPLPKHADITGSSSLERLLLFKELTYIEGLEQMSACQICRQMWCLQHRAHGEDRHLVEHCELAAGVINGRLYVLVGHPNRTLHITDFESTP